MGEMRIIASSLVEEFILPQFKKDFNAGDTKIVWDPINEDEVEGAEAQFDLLINKGFTAFSVKKDGEKNKKITSFKSKAGRIILVPSLVGG